MISGTTGRHPDSGFGFGRIMLNIYALGSGSAGNSLGIASDRESLIIDLGFSRRELLGRMESLGFPTETLLGALLSHEHSDHSKGCRVFCNTQGIPLCATARTAEYLRRRGQLPGEVRLFEAGSSFTLGGFVIEAFPVQHDAEDPVGFIIRRDGYKIGVATDLGEVNNLARMRLCDCDALVLESNYDREMLRASDRELRLKRRIAGRHGHLGNLDACNALASLLTDRTRLLLLAHVSRECNTFELARSGCAEKLRELGRNRIVFDVIEQELPLGVFTFSGGGLEVSRRRPQ